jgi:DNA-directed RNA polymerase specialized sigma24 family protein
VTTNDQLDRALRLATVSVGAARGELPASRREDAYEVLAHVQNALADLEEAQRGAVELYRSLGASWADVGHAFGISRQAAHERFASPSAVMSQ